MEDEREDRREYLLRALALNWAIRAYNKQSNAGFNGCMDHLRVCVPEEIWQYYDLDKVSLHNKEKLRKYIDDLAKEIPTSLTIISDGSMPVITDLENKIG